MRSGIDDATEKYCDAVDHQRVKTKWLEKPENRKQNACAQLKGRAICKQEAWRNVMNQKRIGEERPL